MGLRTDLRDQIQEKLIPILLHAGFEQIESEVSLKRHFPFGRFRRVRNDVCDILEIQFDKHGKPKFVVNFDSFPLSQQISNRPFAGRLYARVFHLRWFGPSLLDRIFPSKNLAEKIVGQLLEVFPEVEIWFEQKQSGSHLKLWPLQ